MSLHLLPILDSFFLSKRHHAARIVLPLKMNPFCFGMIPTCALFFFQEGLWSFDAFIVCCTSKWHWDMHACWGLNGTMAFLVIPWNTLLASVCVCVCVFQKWSFFSQASILTPKHCCSSFHFWEACVSRWRMNGKVSIIFQRLLLYKTTNYVFLATQRLTTMIAFIDLHQLTERKKDFIWKRQSWMYR